MRSRFSARLAIYQERKAIKDTLKIINVASALILGETPMRTDENTTIGKVVAPGPDAKLAITKSSKDKLKDSNQPAINAGDIIGTVIKKKVLSGVAPKSIAASSIDLSSSRNLDDTTTAT